MGAAYGLGPSALFGATRGRDREPMRTLLIEPTRAQPASLARDLDAAGHEVVRCHPADGPAFPCVGLEDRCPLDAAAPVDVAIAVRDQARPQPTAEEAGVTCAIRAGLPVVVVGPEGPNPFSAWSESCAGPEGVVAATERAIASVAARRAAPIAAEVERLIALEGVDAGTVEVSVARSGGVAP